MAEPQPAASTRVVRTCEELREALAEAARPLGLVTTMGWLHEGHRALMRRARDDSIGALAQRSGLDQSTLSRTLRGLERAGLVEITINEEDQRRRAVWLTERGARRLERAIPVWRSAHDALAERIGARGLRAIAALRGVLARMGAEGG